MSVDSYYLRALLERAEAAVDQAKMALAQAMAQLDDAERDVDELDDQSGDAGDDPAPSPLAALLQQAVSEARGMAVPRPELTLFPSSTSELRRLLSLYGGKDSEGA